MLQACFLLMIIALGGKFSACESTASITCYLSLWVQAPPLVFAGLQEELCSSLTNFPLVAFNPFRASSTFPWRDWVTDALTSHRYSVHSPQGLASDWQCTTLHDQACCYPSAILGLSYRQCKLLSEAVPLPGIPLGYPWFLVSYFLGGLFILNKYYPLVVHWLAYWFHFPVFSIPFPDLIFNLLRTYHKQILHTCLCTTWDHVFCAFSSIIYNAIYWLL